jgi:hypothetical protein
MPEKSLYDTIAGFFTGGDEEAKAKEMVMAPPPPEPVLTQNPGESSLDFSMRKRKAMMEYRALLNDREMNPGNYMIPAAEAEEVPAGERDRFDRRRQIEEAIESAE